MTNQRRDWKNLLLSSQNDSSPLKGAEVEELEG